MAALRYLKEDGSFNRSAIMRAAHNIARADVARAAAKGLKRRYVVALRDALTIHVWTSAQVERQMATQAVEAAKLPPVRATALEVLRSDAFCARAIESLPAYLAAMASVSARAAAMGVSL